MKSKIFHPIVLKFCFLGALDRFMLIYSVYLIFFAKIGLSPALIGIALSVYEIGKICGNPVSATLADKYGRKILISIGFIFKATGVGLWAFMPSVQSAFIGVLLIGIGQSGTSNIDSYMYDEFKANSLERYFKSAIAMKSIVTNMSASVGGYVTSLLYSNFGFSGVFTTSAMLMILVSIPYVIFCLQDSKLYTIDNKNKSLMYVAKNGFLEIKNDRIMFYAILLVSMFFSAYIMYTDTNKMIMNDIGFTPDVIAKIYAVAHITPIFTTLIFLIFRPGLLIRGVIVIAMIIWIAIAVTSYMFYGKPLVAVILVFLFMYPIFETCIKDNMHRLISKSSLRSTIVSFSYLLSSTLNIFFSLFIGFIAHHYSYKVAIIAFSFTISALIFTVMLIQRIKVMKRLFC
ncbi:MFS transporter [Candidatus Deianiraea vastatrix]|uniref:Major Facilitator Superfamily protein n=1 Tax=Candidatus Deianiraea vastatrix TaxID=2163644 RepID=A0A5B8XEI2_9RICK|nr:MFS transporter [Candidatus Deianiraea vastatrix]QED23749.1 Major Facilitator Superfamily protein [Candidatus Deianiraea vastatrix]